MQAQCQCKIVMFFQDWIRFSFR